MGRTLAAILLLLTCGCARDGLDWEFVTRPDLGFSMSFPGQALEDRHVSREWSEVSVRRFTAAIEDGTSFTLCVVDYAAGRPEMPYGLFQRLWPQEKRISESDAAWSGHPGRALVTEKPGGVMVHGRVTRVGDRLYEATVSSRARPFPEAAANRFLDSFRVVTQ